MTLTYSQVHVEDWTTYNAVLVSWLQDEAQDEEDNDQVILM